MKLIELKFEDELWQIPLKHVAENRADYYKEKDGEDFNYKEEIDFIMEDSYEGIDWLCNNMDYKDFKNVLKKVKLDFKDEDRDWMNAESEIVEV